jgi:N-methylhydantoinase B/oxoprolinase/acetone carboxylase alpha subunit
VISRTSTAGDTIVHARARRHALKIGVAIDAATGRVTVDLRDNPDGTINPALGARGGLAGSRANALKRELDGSLTQLPACHGVTLRPGERVLSYSAGSGGYGPPWERDPARVKHDLDEGWITRERAAKVYGVVLDEAATRAKRAALAAAGAGTHPMHANRGVQ